MAYCTKCGKTIPEGHRFCMFCGTAVPAAAAVMTTAARSAGSENDLALFVGKNTDKYLAKFRKFAQDGGDSFAATWHWPAFFFSFWWMLYRKMYLWAALVLLLGCVPYVGLIMMAVFGISGNYLYYRHAKRSVAEIRSGGGSEVDIAAKLARAGGVNNVAVVVAPLLIIAIAGILAAIAIPQFALYRQKAFDALARQQVVEACGIGAELFASDPAREAVTPEDLMGGGLEPAAGVQLMLLDGSREGFSISARHAKGRKTFITDPQCEVRVEEGAAGRPQEPQQEPRSDI